MNKRLKTTLFILFALFVLCTGLCGGGSFLSGWAINGSGPVQVSAITADWKVEVDSKENPIDAVKVKEALETKCTSMGNGWRILYNHAWYNMFTSGYDVRMWVSSEKGYSYYGLYIWGNFVFLRNGISAENYQNRVLSCELEPNDWTAL